MIDMSVLSMKPDDEVATQKLMEFRDMAAAALCTSPSLRGMADGRLDKLWHDARMAIITH